MEPKQEHKLISHADILLIVGILILAVAGLFAWKKLKTPVAQRNENLIVSRTLQYIATHVYDKMSVESVAREAGVSTSHLTALFHRQMDISPGEYIRRVKLEESKNLIREGRLNFSQIAAATSASMPTISPVSSLNITHSSGGRNFCFLVNISTTLTLLPT